MTKKPPTGDDGYTDDGSPGLDRIEPAGDGLPCHCRKPAGPQEAARDLIEDLDSMAASASNIPEEEMDQLIDEAIRNVRH